MSEGLHRQALKNQGAKVFLPKMLNVILELITGSITACYRN